MTKEYNADNERVLVLWCATDIYVNHESYLYFYDDEPEVSLRVKQSVVIYKSAYGKKYYNLKWLNKTLGYKLVIPDSWYQRTEPFRVEIISKKIGDTPEFVSMNEIVKPKQKSVENTRIPSVKRRPVIRLDFVNEIEHKLGDQELLMVFWDTQGKEAFEYWWGMRGKDSFLRYCEQEAVHMEQDCVFVK
jgi:hypothetical protein